MTKLTPLVTMYVAGRRARGEINDRTAKTIRSALHSFADSHGDRPLHHLTRKAVERWLETTGDLAPSTRRTMLSAVRGFCRWLVDEGHLETDPTVGVARIRQPRSVPRALTVDEVAALLRVLPDQRARVIVWLMVGCGLRCVEVSRLDVGDYAAEAAALHVVGKGGHERIVPVPRRVQLELGLWLDEIGVVAGPLLRHEDGRARLAPETISTYVSRWFAAAGIKRGRWDGRSAHALRHTCASDVLEACGDLTVVQEMLGHRDLSTTSRYLRRAGLEKMREAMEGRTYAPRLQAA